jgi:hypothetical protein
MEEQIIPEPYDSEWFTTGSTSETTGGAGNKTVSLPWQLGKQGPMDAYIDTWPKYIHPRNLYKKERTYKFSKKNQDQHYQSSLMNSTWDGTSLYYKLLPFMTNNASVEITMCGVKLFS